MIEAAQNNTTYRAHKLGTWIKINKGGGEVDHYLVTKVDGDVMTCTHQEFTGSYNQAMNGGGSYITKTHKIKIQAETGRIEYLDS